MRPGLTPENDVALKVWRFCEGWHPERIPLGAAFYGVDDIELLVEQLMALRDTISAHKAAQQRAS